MKKLLVLTILCAIIVPSAAHAAWWNPTTWRAFQKKATSTADMATTTNTEIAVEAPKIDDSSKPTYEDLQRRISELEQKLEDMRSKLKITELAKSVIEQEAKAATKSVAVISPTPAVSVAPSISQIGSKIKPAIVYIETATTTGSGIIIDPQGYVLTDAHVVWIQNGNKEVVGALEKVTVTLPNGSKKTARLVGIDEGHDLAMLKLDGGSYPFVNLNNNSSVKVGDSAYIVSYPSLPDSAVNGYSVISATVSKKKTDSLELSSEKKPLDNGGAIVNIQGNFMGIPDKSSCKVLEEMKNCLKYTITSDGAKGVFPKLMAGMKLYKDKKSRTAQEALVRGKLEGFYSKMSESLILDYAVNGMTGKNSFDYFNSRLSGDQDGKITKLYLNKLKLSAINIYRSYEYLKNEAYDLSIFFINESSSNESLDDYQVKTIKSIQAINAAKLKVYEKKVDVWSAKKNEYDALLTRPQEATHDFLTEQGVMLEGVAEDLKAEKKSLIELFSGESVNIF